MSDKIDIETIENDFNQFCDDWWIKTDDDNWTEEDRSSFQSQKEKIIDAMKRSFLFYDADEKNMVWTIDGQTIKMSIPNGGAYLEMDNVSESKMVQKQYALLGRMCNKNKEFFNKMDARYLRSFTAVATIFLAS